LILLTSLGGHTFAWSSPETLGMLAVAVSALAGFIVVEHRAAEPILPRHRQLGISRLTESAMGLSDASDTHDYAAIATPVTLAQVAKAWVRPDPRFAAVSWSRRRGKTFAT
jgi:hypothetical protein